MSDSGFLDDIRRFLQGEGGPVPLAKIYLHIESKGEVSPSPEKETLMDNVRATLGNNSSDSYRNGKPNRPKYDFFGKKTSKRDGMWFLRDSPQEILQLGRKYSRKELEEKEVFDTNDLGKESVYYSKKPTLTVLFADVETSGDRTRDHFFENDRFHWDSRASHHNDHTESDTLLFWRMHPETENKPQSYTYGGTLKNTKHEKGALSPTHIVYKSLDYPNETEREGLVTSRVGQGYYRDKLIDRWNKRCAVTGFSATDKILIASHIVPWRDSEESQWERLDEANGILLSPNIDALFDRHLISFTDEGHILISNTLDKAELEKLGINETLTLSKAPKDENEGVDKYNKYLKRHSEYLERHRKAFDHKQS